jgi:hypothetical protein
MPLRFTQGTSTTSGHGVAYQSQHVLDGDGESLHHLFWRAALKIGECCRSHGGSGSNLGLAAVVGAGSRYVVE